MSFHLNPISKRLLIGAGILTTMFLASCEKTPVTVPPAGNDPEVITTFKLTFADAANPVAVVRATYRDNDGPGGNAPTRFDSIVLKPNKTYNVDIEIINEIPTPDDTITQEIRSEANDHQFFFTPQAVNVIVNYDDEDNNTPPRPVGLKTTWETGPAGTGKMRIRLKHQPGTKDGNASTGVTDIDLVFDTRVGN